MLNPSGLCLCGCGQPAPLAPVNNKNRGWIKGEAQRYVAGHQNCCPKITPPNPSGICQCGCGQAAPLAKCTSSFAGWIKGQPVRFCHGHFHQRIHGKSKTVEFHAYHQAKQRCTNTKGPNWKDYGGRGIRFLFTSFEEFFAHIGPRPEGKTLDRINNDGNYEVGNVRWATKTEQVNNQRIRKDSRRVAA